MQKPAATGLGATLSCVLLLAASGSARAQVPSPRAERLSVELGLHGAPVLAHGTDTLVGGGGQFTFQILWPVATRVRMGAQTALLVTPLPTATAADLRWLGKDPNRPDAPFGELILSPFLSVSYAIAVHLWRGLDLAASAGVVVTLTGGGPVLPRLGVGALYTVYRHSLVQLAVRVGCEIYPLVSHRAPVVLFLPVVGLVVRFPVRENPGSMKGGDLPSPVEPHQPGPRF